jgi:protein subunit release factor B
MDKKMKHSIIFLIWCLSRTSIKTSQCFSLSRIYLLLEVAAQGAGGQHVNNR